MKVTVIEPKGYCAGVVCAINIALCAKIENPGKKAYVLGMLVHNNETIQMLRYKGIEFLEGDNKEDLINSIKDGSILIFTAHGHDEKLDKIAEAKNLIVYDATCGFVKNNMKLAKQKLEDGYKIIFIGKKNHPETEAFLSLSNDIQLVEENKPINYYFSTNDRIFVINQTTLNYSNLLKIHQEILAHYPNATIQNEVCFTTRLRQENLRNIDKDVDLIVVVGSTISNNTQELFSIAKSMKSESVLVESPDEIDLDFIENKNHIVVVSGASTPSETVDMIVDKIKSLR